MRTPIVTAVVDPRWESGLVSAFGRDDHGLTVVRRCVDLADLLATAATGTASAVLLSADLRRLDRDALARLRLAGLAVVGLVAPGDEPAERRLRQLGIRWVLAGDTAPEVIAQAVTDAVAELAAEDGAAGNGSRSGVAAGYGVPLAGLPTQPPEAAREDVLPGTGRVLAVWGPTGAPGRTTVAVHLAGEFAALGIQTLVVDADVYGGVVGQHLGLVEEPPGLPAACRQANNGVLDVPALAGLAREVGPKLRVLTGINRADRWPELRPAALEVVLAHARTLAEVVVVDCGFCLEQDEELSYDTAAPRRNGATLTALEQADTVLAVVAADPVGVTRGVRGLAQLRETLPGLPVRVVVNKLRRQAVGRDPDGQVRAALQRYADLEPVAALPYDVATLDAALVLGRTLAEQGVHPALRESLTALAAELLGVPRPARRQPVARWRRAR